MPPGAGINVVLRRPIKIHRAAKGETFMDPMQRRE
jgi:hypothetical protein